MPEVETIRRGLDATTVRGARIESVEVLWPPFVDATRAVLDIAVVGHRISAIRRLSRLPNHTGSMFTTIEGECDEVVDVVHRASDAAAAYGSRVDLVIKGDIRAGHDHELTGKVEHLEKAIAEQARTAALK